MIYFLFTLIILFFILTLVLNALNKDIFIPVCMLIINSITLGYNLKEREINKKHTLPKLITKEQINSIDANFEEYIKNKIKEKNEFH